jgi:hypothetical protein
MKLTQERLKELLHYDPDSGLFINKTTRATNTSPEGSVAGTYVPAGYIRLCIDNKIYSAHRLAFLYMEGYIPKEVDHDNQIKSDNRWCNLTAADHTTNSMNRSVQSNSSSGHLGVLFDKNRNKWRVHIKVNQVQIFLGRFDNKEDAIQARKDAEVLYGFNQNHGKKK